MKAMVFAAGLGTRLKPFTDLHPKALAPVCGTPVLGRVIERLKSAGVDEIVVNVHHFADQIVDYIKANGDFGIKVHISDETECLLDTGGGILAARRWLDGEPEDRFIVHNADILTDIDLSRMLADARRRQSAATLLVAERQTSRYLLFNHDDMLMRGWVNVNTGQVRPESLSDPEAFRKLAFGGVHVLSPSVFPALDNFADTIRRRDGRAHAVFSIVDFYISACGKLPVYGWLMPPGSHWHDIGRPESLAAAEKDYGDFSMRTCK